MQKQRRKLFFIFWLISELFFVPDSYASTRRLWWVHPMNQQRGNGPRGEFHSQVQELWCYPNRFYQYFHMTVQKFDELLGMVTNSISKENMNWQHSISAEE